MQTKNQTKSTRVAINGFGRIGMLTSRVLLEKFPELEIIAINDLAEERKLQKALSDDFIYGKFAKKVNCRFFQERDPEKLPWLKLGIDIVLECSGVFTDKGKASKHLIAGCKKVIISAPAKSGDISTFVLGVNEKEYKGEQIISMGSCTTNAAATVIKVLNDIFGIKKCFLSTTHSYTASQDKMYPNWKKEKAVDLSIIPYTTGAAKTVEKVIPSLKGKINGLALRVPTATVSIVDIVVLLERSVSVEEINKALEAASQVHHLKNILQVEIKPLVSTDLIKSPYSAVVAVDLTQVLGDFCRVLVWYDNEWAYACRLAEMTEYIAGKP